MLDYLLEKEEVIEFIEQLKNNERYYMKKSNYFTNCSYVPTSREIALYIFYDALLKYHLIITSDVLFLNYIEQLDRLYKKLDSFDDIRLGINKLICRLLADKLKIKDLNSKESKEIIIKTIYDKYVINGYLIHGFSSIYYDSINNNGLVPEVYNNYYNDFIEINNIFKKYNLVDAFMKDFNLKSISFTDDIVMGCFYSVHSPMFYSQFFSDEKFFGKNIHKDYYLVRNYNHLKRNVKIFMNLHLFTDEDQDKILEIIDKEWNLLHKERERICLLLVPRNNIDYNIISIDEYLKDIDSSDIFDLVDSILVSKYSSILYNKQLFVDNFNLLTFDFEYYDKSFEKPLIDKEYEEKKDEVSREFLDVYGKTSILILVGAIFISLGVIISIILILKEVVV